MTSRVALVVAIVLGVLSIYGIKLYVDKIKREVRQGEEPVTLVVATQDIPRNTIILEDQVMEKTFPRRFVQALRDSVNATNVKRKVVGNMAVTTVLQNQIVQLYHIREMSRGSGIRPTDRWRTVTIPVSFISGVAGMVRPGDYVDVCGVFTLSDPSSRIKKPEPVACTVLKRVYVYACDNFTEVDSAKQYTNYNSITLRVTSEERSKMLLAMSKGTLSLSKVEENQPPVEGWSAMRESEWLDDLFRGR